MKRNSDADLLCMACATVLVACGALAEALYGDWTMTWKDLLFGALVVMTFLIARIIYGAIGTLSRAQRYPEPATEPCEEILARKEAFAANVLTIANPLAEPHDFALLPLYETERIIASGRYRLELVRSDNDKPVLVLCED